MSSKRDDASNKLLTVRELAQYLGVPRGWVYRHVRPGSSDQLPSFRIGKYRRFRTADVDRWLANRSQP